MIKAIGFDLDNTLIDFMKFKEETAEAAAKAMVESGLNEDPSTVSDQIFEIYDEYGIEYQKTFASLLWEKQEIRNFSEFEKIQQAGIIAYQRKKLESLKTYPEVKNILKKLKKKLNGSIYIITDAPRNKAWQRMYITELYPYFNTEQVFTLDKTNERKPSLKPFKAFLEETEFNPKEVLFVGDSLERDVKGASRAGLKTALAKYGQIKQKKIKEKPDYVLNEFKEILEILEI
ncbi:MAG: HAD-IA family hydrolase [archaeon]